MNSKQESWREKEGASQGKAKVKERNSNKSINARIDAAVAKKLKAQEKATGFPTPARLSIAIIRAIHLYLPRSCIPTKKASIKVREDIIAMTEQD